VRNGQPSESKLLDPGSDLFAPGTRSPARRPSSSWSERQVPRGRVSAERSAGRLSCSGRPALEGR
jgi:hypothetical protein